MSRKIAPNLTREITDLLELCASVSPPDLAEEQAAKIRIALRELRDLKALVAALDRHMRDPVGVGFKGIERARARLSSSPRRKA